MGIELGKQEARLGIPMGAYDPAASTIEIGPATEDTQGIIAIATEELAKEGVNDETAITPLKLAKVLDEKIVDAYTKEEVDTKLEGVETEITSAKADIAGVETTVQGLGTTVEGLTTNVEGIHSDIDTITTNLEDVTSSVTDLAAAMQTKQDTLVSGTNIKTINGETVLGEGDIEIKGGGNPLIAELPLVKTTEAKDSLAQGLSIENGQVVGNYHICYPTSSNTFNFSNGAGIKYGTTDLGDYLNHDSYIEVPLERDTIFYLPFVNNSQSTDKGAGWTVMVGTKDEAGNFYPQLVSLWNIFSYVTVGVNGYSLLPDGNLQGYGSQYGTSTSSYVSGFKRQAFCVTTDNRVQMLNCNYSGQYREASADLRTAYLFNELEGATHLRFIPFESNGIVGTDFVKKDTSGTDLQTMLNNDTMIYLEAENNAVPVHGELIVTDKLSLNVDNETITVNQSGAIAAKIATADTVGIAKPDGTTITVDEEGTLSAVKQGTDFETANPIYMDEQREYTHLHGITDFGDTIAAEVGYFSDYPSDAYGSFTNGDTVQMARVDEAYYFDTQSYVEVPLELDTTYLLPGDFTDDTGNGRGMWTPIIGRKDSDGHFFPLMFPAKNSDFSYYYYNIYYCDKNESNNTANIWGARNYSNPRYGISAEQAGKSYAFSVNSYGQMQFTSGPNQWGSMYTIGETSNHIDIVNQATHIRFLPYSTTCGLSSTSKFGKVVGKNATDLSSEALYAQAIANAEPIADAIVKNVLTLDIDTETLAVTEEGKLSVIGGGGEAVTPDGVTIQFNENNQLKTSIDINALAEKVEDMQLFKFPNATIIGEPTIQNGQISDFSTVSYLQFPFVLDLHDRALRIDFCFTTDTNVQTQQNILDSNYGLALAIKDGKGLMAVSSTGTSWDIGQAVGTADIQSNTTYFARLIWDKTQYKTMLSTDNEHFEEDMVLDSTAHPFPRTIFIGGCDQLETGHDPHPFLGTINLNKCDVYVDDVLIWQGMDDVGLATRADVSLSNLNEEGIALFDAKQDKLTSDGSVILKDNKLSLAQTESRLLADKIGDVKIDDNFVATNFSDSNYLTFTCPLRGTEDSWEIIVPVKSTDNSISNAGIIDSNNTQSGNNVRFTLSSGKPRLRIASSLTSGSFAVDITSSSTLTLNTKYYVKASYNGSTGYAIAISTNKETWTTVATSTSTTKILWKEGLLWYIGDNIASGLWFEGSIYLSEIEVNANGSNVYKAIEPTGGSPALATNDLFGLVKPDNTTIGVSKGVLSSKFVISDKTSSTTNAYSASKTDTLLSEKENVITSENPIVKTIIQEGALVGGTISGGVLSFVQTPKSSSNVMYTADLLSYGGTSGHGTFYVNHKEYIEFPFELGKVYFIPETAAISRNSWYKILGKKDVEGNFYPLMFEDPSESYNYRIRNITGYTSATDKVTLNTSNVSTTFNWSVYSSSEVAPALFGTTLSGKIVTTAGAYFNGNNQTGPLYTSSAVSLSDVTHIRFVPTSSFTNKILSSTSEFRTIDNVAQVVNKNEIRTLYDNAETLDLMSYVTTTTKMSLEHDESLTVTNDGKLRAATTPSYSTAYVLEQRISEDETDNAIYFTNTGKDALVTFNYTIANPEARSYDYEIYPDVESAPDVFQHYFYHVGFVTLPIRAGATIKITSESFNRVEATTTQYFLVTAIPFV